ncbi:MAG: peptidoglycan DD-metalloendopeptidase family protein [Acutalibacteraceae bacterium]|nr:peptidoglycan DD-metalloendopeptidase family protein [Acutalibacteraceae bacterium]
MNNENKKVNNAENKDSKKKSVLDEIADGFYDLSELYSQPVQKKTLTREEELKRKDEERRALEMQAIKEDIERRYSLQLETAQSKASPKKKPAPVTETAHIDSREAVKEELERIDGIINDGSLSVSDAESKEEKPVKKSARKKKAKKERIKKETAEKTFDTEELNPVYALFYNYGNTICTVLSAVLAAVFGLIKKPFISLYKFLSRVTESTKRKTTVKLRNTVKEAAHFRKEIKHAGKSIRRAFKKPLSLPSVLSRYIRLAIHRHSGLLKSATNILLPIGALAVFLITVNYWNNATFALEVIYNDRSIGYISNESVYVEAKSLVKDRLTGSVYADTSKVEATVAASPNLNASYNLSIVSVDELNDAQAISDKIIENSVDNLTNACGVYIDGEFICAVKNEADAKTVFYDILEPYEAEAELNGYAIGFAENIDYVQGLYRDDKDVMWEASQLAEILNGEEKLISIRKIVTTTSVQDIRYETVKRRDATKYSGYRQVLQKGINGSERVIKTQIYIDGVLQDTEYLYETITEPVAEVVVVGTRTSYGGVYIGEASDSGFLWPAPSCHRVSSPYGWRSSGWHNGIDLVKAGGGASGTPVIASRSGRVEVVQRSSSGYGNMVLINHGDGYKTRYAHMIKGSITVSVGDYVEAGRTIGKVGSTGNSTGPHLHFEVIRNGETQNPKNYIY